MLHSDSKLLETFGTPDEVYRSSTIGLCLTRALEELIDKEMLTPQLAIQVLLEFDESMIKAMSNLVTSKVSIKGHLRFYRNIEGVWNFFLRDAVLKSEDCEETVGQVKIVAVDAKLIQ